MAAEVTGVGAPEMPHGALVLERSMSPQEKAMVSEFMFLLSLIRRPMMSLAPKNLTTYGDDSASVILGYFSKDYLDGLKTSDPKNGIPHFIFTGRQASYSLFLTAEQEATKNCIAYALLSEIQCDSHTSNPNPDDYAEREVSFVRAKMPMYRDESSLSNYRKSIIKTNAVPNLNLKMSMLLGGLYNPFSSIADLNTGLPKTTSAIYASGGLFPNQFPHFSPMKAGSRQFLNFKNVQQRAVRGFVSEDSITNSHNLPGPFLLHRNWVYGISPFVNFPFIVDDPFPLTMFVRFPWARIHSDTAIGDFREVFSSACPTFLTEIYEEDDISKRKAMCQSLVRFLQELHEMHPVYGDSLSPHPLPQETQSKWQLWVKEGGAKYFYRYEMCQDPILLEQEDTGARFIDKKLCRDLAMTLVYLHDLTWLVERASGTIFHERNSTLPITSKSASTFHQSLLWADVNVLARFLKQMSSPLDDDPFGDNELRRYLFNFDNKGTTFLTCLALDSRGALSGSLASALSNVFLPIEENRQIDALEHARLIHSIQAGGVSDVNSMDIDVISKRLSKTNLNN